ncbi:protein IWS1 homolog 1-like [Impatiens glandulifera]|uniref:protein IWS1 homolog 1-like n=1 Tax=Impatiens glandulifera TaxID=253017 RepID=UPI001FB16F58|nr:protein IWS1 homolog 1-like [Impatiens glandulifera]
MEACQILTSGKLYYRSYKMYFPIDLEQSGIRDQLKKSGLGKVIMFLSKSDEEIMSNKRLAKELQVDKWCRSIFNNNARFEDRKKYGDERIPSRKSSKKTRMKYRDDDINFAELPKGQNSRHSSSRNHVSRPEAMPMDFVVRPPSKVDPDAIRARSKHVVRDHIQLKNFPSNGLEPISSQEDGGYPHLVTARLEERIILSSLPKLI